LDLRFEETKGAEEEREGGRERGREEEEGGSIWSSTSSRIERGYWIGRWRTHT
jgi:hypothetical protein